MAMSTGTRGIGVAVGCGVAVGSTGRSPTNPGVGTGVGLTVRPGGEWLLKQGNGQTVSTGVRRDPGRTELAVFKFEFKAGAPDRGGNVLPAVRQLMAHPDFQLRNPNRARSVIFSYCNANPGAFHRADAAGYVFWSERVLELDRFNPQVAARLARALDRWKKLAEPYRSAAREAIARVAAQTELSNDVREVVTRALSED